MTPCAPRHFEADDPGGAYLFAALLGLVGWLPVPLGSNRPWSAALMEGVALSLLGAWFTCSLVKSATPPMPLRAARGPLALLCVWLVYLLVQALPLPGALRGLAGAPYQIAAAVVGDPPSVALSVDRGATLAAFLKASSYVATFTLVVALAAQRRRLIVLCWVLVAVGAGESLLGLSVYLAGINAPGTAVGIFDPAGVAGTYVNRNHFAGLLEMTAAMALGLFLAPARAPVPRRGTRAWFRRTTRALLGVRGVLAFCLVLMASALLLSASRGGVGAFSLALIAVAVLSASRSRSWRETGRSLTVVLVAAIIAGVWLGTGNLETKVEEQGLASNRGDLRDVTYEMLAGRWVFGSGAGTYRWVIPAYEDERFGPLYYEHAHNDYLETLSEQGVVGSFWLFAAVAWLLLRMARAYRTRRHPRLRGILFGSLLGCLSLAIHGTVDFNFQIPANAAYFLILLAVGTVASEIGRSRDRRPRRPEARGSGRGEEAKGMDAGVVAAGPGPRSVGPPSTGFLSNLRYAYDLFRG